MQEPAGAPICWGKQFGDEDDECKNCNYNQSCRPATINRHAVMQSNGVPQLPIPQRLPVIQQQQPPPFAPRFGGVPTLPQPTGYPRTPPLPPMIGQTPQAPMAPQPHAPIGWNTPIAYLPRPNPQNPAWWQYQGETTAARLGKNMLLSALQALFSELLRFLSNWTWPKVPVTT